MKEWYAALHARPEFVARKDEQIRAAGELARRYPGKPHRGPQFREGSKYFASELRKLGVDVTAEAVEEQARRLFETL